MSPSRLFKDKDTIVEEKSIFFNSNESWYWENIDKISDEKFYINEFPSDFFLTTFFHEFSHIVHEEHLINKLGAEKVINLIKKVLKMQHNSCNPHIYRLLIDICTYATTSPFEAIACDFSKRIANCLDKNSLIPSINFIKNSPYKNNCLKDYIFDTKSMKEKDKLLHKFWNGKSFEKFYKPI